MSKFLSPNVVNAIKADAGSEFVTVTFQKVDGSVRVLNGHFKALKHMVGGDAGAKASARNQAHGLVAIWEPKAAKGLPDPKGGWRSFKADRVISISTKGRTYKAD